MLFRSPEHLDEFFVEVMRLLKAHAASIDPVDLERAHNQIAVRRLRAQEKPFRRLEDAAQDLFALGRVRSCAELAARIEAVTADQVRTAFERMLAAPASVAITGKVGKGVRDRVGELVATAR